MNRHQSDERVLPSTVTWSCPTPLVNSDRVLIGHGGGGKLTADLISRIFLPHFKNAHLDRLCDAATVAAGSAQVALATDAFVVRPLFFPGGNIGDLAVNGTVNDLAMSGAVPRYLTASFVLEEGLLLSELEAIVGSMGRAAKRAGVEIVAGDTKVVERGRGDGCYISTAGVGAFAPGIDLDPRHAQPGDVVLLSGTIGEHGMAIMSVREGLEFESPIVSDSAPLNGLAQTILRACPDTRVLRDPTRGGVATALIEIAQAAGVGIQLEETAVPVQPPVAAACELLGIDPLYVANEGKLLAIVPPDDADAVLAAMRQHEYGREAVVVGAVVGRSELESSVALTMRTSLGARRVISMPIGEQLPRIC
ncbi:MAG: hydrogenase expression/formation protein HypE [Planctomycetales bacterium]|nr:hydrogenase expression/formation protein HypE [Planctomycetales bacterium]MCA9166422.1 hydrogenase expression/formation protein HypE [Planctomycetales bacterium]